MSEQSKRTEDINADIVSEWDELADDTSVVAAERLDKTSQNKFGQTVEGLVNDVAQSTEATHQNRDSAPLGSRENPVVVEYPGGTMNTANKAASTKIGGPK